ncbi:MAG: A24 family peptidase [Alphaproteobacteria bacterium]|nr:A24 family peptidase [Alphaproteobacteria bacterium]
MIAISETIWIIASLALGLMIGSFLNVVIYRLPRMMDARDDDILDQETGDNPDGLSATATLSLSFPGSHCPKCGHGIRTIENIPVLSYCFLRGRCAACHQAVSKRYPIVELLGAAGAAGCVCAFGPTYQALVAMVFVWFTIIIAFIDLDHLMVPDPLSIPLVWMGLSVNAFGIFATPSQAILGAVSGYSALWVVNAIAARALGRTAIGQGDFKLFAAIGAWLGWQSLAPALLIASAIGVATSYFLIWTERMSRGQPICFAPFLLIAAVAVMLSDGQVAILIEALLTL